MNLKHLLMLFCLVIIPIISGGCAGLGQIVDLTSLDSTQIARYKNMAELDNTQIARDKYEVIGRGKGLSCKGNLYSRTPVTEDEARQQLRANAVKMGGNALINIVCNYNRNVDWGNNCWESVVCVGDVIKIHDRELIASVSYPGKKQYDSRNQPEPSKVNLGKNDNRKIDLKVSKLGHRWAVIVGVSEYSDSRLPSLLYANRDAEEFHNWLVSTEGGRYAPSKVRLLLNSEATYKNMKNSLFVWLKQALEEDVVTIFFAGHGSPESPDSLNNLFLLPYDAQYDDIATSSFPMWDIETSLKRFIKAKKVIVIADACHAGGVGQSFYIARRANRAIKVNPISSALQSLSKIGDGVCVISASDDKQYSQEGQKWGGGHGVFTYFLLEGLKGESDYNKDNIVSLGEIIPYLSEQVRRATRNAQSPTVAGRFDPALSIGR